MTDLRFGLAIRLLRLKRRWRQRDLAARAGVSQGMVSRIERGHLDTVTLLTIRKVGAALDMRVDVVGRYRGGDLDRMLGAGHSALHESVGSFLHKTSGWRFASEVSFSIYGDRGIIDILAWHEPTRSLLVVELKTDLVDFNELLGTLDKKRRLAAQVARSRGWLDRAATVSVWVVVADSRTNRRRAAAHATMLRTAFPLDGRAIRSWLRLPEGSIASLGFWSVDRGARRTPVRRVRRAGSGGRAEATVPAKG